MSARINKILIAAVCVVSALAVFFRAYLVAWNSDECVYAFKLGKAAQVPVEPLEKIQTAMDAIVSQYNQYSGNGRFMIHFITQMFCGPWGQTAFSIWNALLLLFVLYVFIRLTQHKENRRNGVVWFLACFGLLYLSPEPSTIWYVPAMSLNYLLTMFTSILFFLCYQKLIERDHWSKWQVAGVALYAFAAGWMNESYTIPISGALFFWLLLHRKQWNASRIIVAIAFCLGTLMVTLGSLERASSASHVLSMVWHAFELFLQLKIVWLTLLGCIVFWCKNKLAFLSFVRENQLYFLMLGCAVLLGCFANTGPRSLMGLEFASAVILFKQIDRYFLKVKSLPMGALYGCLCCIVLIGVHQTLIARDVQRMHDITLEVVDEAKTTKDGVIRIPDVHFSTLTRPFVLNWMETDAHGWFGGCVALYYMNRHPFYHLHEKDYNAIKHPEQFFIPENRMPGDAPVYCGDTYYWIRESDIPSGRTLLCEFGPVPILQSPYWVLKAKLSPENYPSKDIITLPDTAEIKNDQGLMMFEKSWRPEISFSYISQE
jgi:hypothetical protein